MKPFTLLTYLSISGLCLTTSSQAALIAFAGFENVQSSGNTSADFGPEIQGGITGVTTTTFDTFETGNGGNNLRYDSNSFSAGAYEGDIAPRVQNASSFTLTFDSSVTINLDSISFAFRGASNTGTGRTVFLNGSVGATGFNQFSQATTTDRNTPSAGSFNFVTIDFNDAGNPLGSPALFDGLTDTSVTFTFSGNNGIDIDAISVNGTLIPEPSAAGLLAIGAIGLLRRRRK